MQKACKESDVLLHSSKLLEYFFCIRNTEYSIKQLLFFKACVILGCLA